MRKCDMPGKAKRVTLPAACSCVAVVLMRVSIRMSICVAVHMAICMAACMAIRVPVHAILLQQAQCLCERAVELVLGDGQLRLELLVLLPQRLR